MKDFCGNMYLIILIYSVNA